MTQYKVLGVVWVLRQHTDSRVRWQLSRSVAVPGLKKWQKSYAEWDFNTWSIWLMWLPKNCCVFCFYRFFGQSTRVGDRNSQLATFNLWVFLSLSLLSHGTLLKNQPKHALSELQHIWRWLMFLTICFVFCFNVVYCSKSQKTSQRLFAHLMFLSHKCFIEETDELLVGTQIVARAARQETPLETTHDAPALAGGFGVSIGRKDVFLLLVLHIKKRNIKQSLNFELLLNSHFKRNVLSTERLQLTEFEKWTRKLIGGELSRRRRSQC